MVDNFEQEILFGDLLPPVAQISKRRAKRDSLLPEGLPEFRVLEVEEGEAVLAPIEKAV